MADKEVRKLSRRELLELVIKQEKENVALRERLAGCERELARRQIAIQNSGTMAEAALKLNKVFEAADEAVRQYMENIRGASVPAEELAPELTEAFRKETEQVEELPESVPEVVAADSTEEKLGAKRLGRFLKKTRVW